MLLPAVAALIGLAVVLAAMYLTDETSVEVSADDAVEGPAEGAHAGRDQPGAPMVGSRASRVVVVAAPDELARPHFPVRQRGYAPVVVDAYVNGLSRAYADLWEAASPEARERARRSSIGRVAPEAPDEVPSQAAVAMGTTERAARDAPDEDQP